MPQDPSPQQTAPVAAPLPPGGSASGLLDRQAQRRRREIVSSPLYLLLALLLHGLILAAWMHKGSSEAPVEEVEQRFTVSAQPVHEPEPLPPEETEPPPAPVLAETLPPQAVEPDVAQAFTSTEVSGAAPGPLDDSRPAGSEVFGVGNGNGGGGGGGGGGGSGGRHSGLGGGAALPTDLGPEDSGFHDFVSDLRARGLDVAFVVDCTESMQKFIDRARATIDDIIADLSTIVPDLRIGIVAYRDRTDDWLTRQVDLTDDRYRIHNFLLDLSAHGGGDFEEALDEGLRQAAEGLAWRPDGRRVMIVVGDAPPHAADLSAALSAVRGFAHDRQSVVDVLYTGVEADRKNVGRDAQARTALEKIARTGNGTLADLSSDNAGLRDLIVEAAFGSEWQKDIRALLAHRRTDWRLRIVQDKVKQRDLAWLLDELGQQPVHPSVVEGALQLFDKTVARRALALLLDETLPVEVRSMALYVLKRKLVPASSLDVTQPLAAQPDPVAKLQRELDKLPEASGARPVVLPPLPPASPAPPPVLPPVPTAPPR